MKREEKKKKLLEFIERKKEERKITRERNKILKGLRGKIYSERKLSREEKIKEKEPQEENFKLNSKRKKERKEKFLEIIAKRREEKKKIKQLLLEEKRKKKLELEARKGLELERRKELERAKQEAREKKRLEQVRKKEELLNLLKKKAQDREKLREKLLLERKERARKREEELERRKIELEARKGLELERRKELERAKQEAREKKRLERIENRQKLLQFLHYKRLHGQINKERFLFLTEIINLRRLIDKERQRALIEEARKLKEETKRLLIEQKREKELQKREILQREREKQKIKTYLSNVIKTVPEIDKLIRTKITEAEKNVANFITTYRKEITKKKPPKVIPKKIKVVPEKKIRPIVYKEPFRLNVFLRKNIFKFVFLILLIVWIWEFFMFMRKTFLSSEERLKMIVGEIVEEKRPKEERKKVVEEEKFAYWTKEKIDIEGKRDPFSTGRLTMEIMKKPVPTNIIFAKKPEVISIVKTPKFISILKPEEKIEKPEIAITPRISTFEKPKIAKGEEISITSKLPEIEKVSKPEITPFALPEKECPLIYRGRMILEGVEYIFIEGTKRTYRVTIGDVVEGYKILKKENNKIILSKEGLLYEINAQ